MSSTRWVDAGCRETFGARNQAAGRTKDPDYPRLLEAQADRAWAAWEEARTTPGSGPWAAVDVLATWKEYLEPGAPPVPAGLDAAVRGAAVRLGMTAQSAAAELLQATVEEAASAPKRFVYRLHQVRWALSAALKAADPTPPWVDALTRVYERTAGVVGLVNPERTR